MGKPVIVGLNRPKYCVHFLLPLVADRRLWIVLVVITLIGGAYVGFRVWRADLISDAKTEVRNEVALRDERRARENAEADRAFLLDQAEKRDADAAALRADLARLSGRIEAGRSTVIERIRSGDLTAGEISAVRLATMAQIARLEAERKTEEAR